MKTDTLKPGDLVVVGNRTAIREGETSHYGRTYREVKEAIFLAKGKFVQVWAPCGWTIKEDPKASSEKNVLAVPHNISKWDDDGKRYVVTEWKPELKTSGTIYDHREYKIKKASKELFKRKAEDWEKKRATQFKKVEKAIKSFTDAVGKDGYCEGYPGGVSRVYLTLDQVAALTKKATAKACRDYIKALNEYNGWVAANPNPGACKW